MKKSIVKSGFAKMNTPYLLGLISRGGMDQDQAKEAATAFAARFKYSNMTTQGLLRLQQANEIPEKDQLKISGILLSRHPSDIDFSIQVLVALRNIGEMAANRSETGQISGLTR